MNGSTITMTGGVTANDTLVLANNPQINGSGVTLVNNGTATFNSGNYIELYNGATFSNAATLNWNFSSADSEVFNNGSGNLFVNTPAPTTFAAGPRRPPSISAQNKAEPHARMGQPAGPMGQPAGPMGQPGGI